MLQLLYYATHLISEYITSKLDKSATDQDDFELTRIC